MNVIVFSVFFAVCLSAVPVRSPGEHEQRLVGGPAAAGQGQSVLRERGAFFFFFGIATHSRASLPRHPGLPSTHKALYLSGPSIMKFGRRLLHSLREEGAVSTHFEDPWSLVSQTLMREGSFRLALTFKKHPTP